MCRILSPVLAALLTLQVSGCAFHTYKDIDKAEWSQIKERTTIRVTRSDRTIVTGHFAALQLALDSATLVDSSILATGEASQSPGTIIITNTRLTPTDSVGFRRTRTVTDSTNIAVGEINRIEKQKGATPANCALIVGLVVLTAGVLAIAAANSIDVEPIDIDLYGGQ